MREPRADAQALIALSAAIATRDDAALSHALRRAHAEADPLAVDEILLQAHLFVGFPIALNALVRWREIAGTSPGSASREAEAEWEARGLLVCERVYGRSYGPLRARVAALHPDLDRWMVTGGYGRVLGRPAVDLVTRELCIAALLAAWNAPEQLRSHLRGALNVGATPAEVERAIETAAAHLDADSAASARELWRGVLARATVAETGSR